MVTIVCIVYIENIILEDHGLHNYVYRSTVQMRNYVYRSTVQMLMSIIDADGAKR